MNYKLQQHFSLVAFSFLIKGTTATTDPALVANKSQWSYFAFYKI